MKTKKYLPILFALASMGVAQAQAPVVHFDMSLDNGKITETTTGVAYTVSSQLPACTAKGVDGEALRFDGYSNYVKAGIPVANLSTTALTINVVLAPETYPMMQVDVAETTPTYATICGNVDEVGKKGIAFELSSQGDLRLRYGSASGFLLVVNGDKKLPRGQWNQLSAVFDKASNSATLYLNGEQIGSGRMSRADIIHGDTDFYIGKDAQDKKEGPFLINTFCGLIDDIVFYNEVRQPSAFAGYDDPDFNYPSSRYEGSLWRPLFHGMPSGSWTNESHGMTYSNGRYHVFFQKNANGPYMSRLHWGHISSENLYDWREELIAIAPGENYDIKGCWSGCVYDDEGTTNILYTAVDNARATIAHAQATDNTLIGWEKKGIVVNGRPSGLSDDFRDPYFFTANGQKYIIVGTSKNNVGACTLHKYENGSWTNDGTLFFQGGNANQHGTFWEMPNVTPVGDGRWLFTCTPLNTGVGVRTLCWVGTIGADGRFTPDGKGVQYLELGGISRDGYGLLSPTIYQKDGKTLLLGIVPDKLPTQTNFEMGWAHNFSLPREVSLDANNQIVQKPYSGLAAMRSATSITKDLTLLGSESLSPVNGRQVELLGEFSATTGTCGFRFLKSGDNQASLTYDADHQTLSLDMSTLSRQSNDGGVYNGVYSVSVPEKLTKLHVFLDGSIVDIFVNDRWAYSVRLFPTDASQVEVEVFATASTPAQVSAWVLDPGITDGVDQVVSSQLSTDKAVYDLAGRRLDTLPQNGTFILNGKKYAVR